MFGFASVWASFADPVVCVHGLLITFLWLVFTGLPGLFFFGDWLDTFLLPLVVAIRMPYSRYGFFLNLPCIGGYLLAVRIYVLVFT